MHSRDNLNRPGNRRGSDEFLRIRAVDQRFGPLHQLHFRNLDEREAPVFCGNVSFRARHLLQRGESLQRPHCRGCHSGDCVARYTIERGSILARADYFKRARGGFFFHFAGPHSRH